MEGSGCDEMGGFVFVWVAAVVRVGAIGWRGIKTRGGDRDGEFAERFAEEGLVRDGTFVELECEGCIESRYVLG